MAKNLPPLNWFRVFETAARCLSFTAAADELGLTQSAVSQQIKALETRLGTPLFIRRPRGLALTDDARKLLPLVGSSLDQLHAAAHMFAPQPSEQMITVAASVSITQWVIAPRLSEFTSLYPTQRIRFVGTIWADEFQNDAADVDIRFGPARAFAPSAQRLKDELIVVAHPDKDPAALPVVETVGTSRGWSDWQKESNLFAHLKPSLFVDSYGLALNLAEQGSAIALVSSLVAKTSLTDGRVKQISASSITSIEGYHINYKANKQAATTFAKWFLQAL